MKFEASHKFLNNSWSLGQYPSFDFLGLKFVTQPWANHISSDAERTILRWFLDGVADPKKYLDSEFKLAHIILDTQKYFREFFEPSSHPDLDLSELTKIISVNILERVIGLRKVASRNKFSKSTKQLLLDLAGKEPRCWLTGYKFQDSAIREFLGGEKAEVKLPNYIDALTPMGLNRADLRIEIDHKHPFSQGGQDDFDNLGLSCGWANRAKSSFISIFDASTLPKIASNLPLGLACLPNPFWVVRVLGTMGQCQEPHCEKTLQNSHLRIVLASQQGAPTPTNLKVVCKEHDYWEGDRFVPRSRAAEIWKKQQSN